MTGRVFRSLLLVFAFFLALAGTVCAADGGAIARATLKNGLRVVVVRNALAPAVAVQLNYLVGSAEAPPGFPGMAHAQEHMMFRGASGLSAAQLNSIIAGIGGEANADTQQVVTQYLSTLAPEDLETMLHVEAIRMAGVLDSQKAWSEERGAIEQEVEQDLSQPEYLMSVQLLEKLFAGTPYHYDALGSRSSFDLTTAAMLRKFHRDWYGPNNAVLIVVGDVDPARTVALARRLFEGIPARPLPGRAKVQLQPLQPALIELESNLPYGLALVAYRLPGYDSPDYAAGKVLGEVLDSKRGQLYALVPAGKALATNFEDMTLPKAGSGYVSAAFPSGTDGRQLLATLKQVVADYLAKGFPAQLVAAAKQREVAQVEFEKTSINGLASSWSQAVAIEGRNSPDDDVQAIQRVTVEDVDRVARAYLINETAITALLVPRPSGKPIAVKSAPRGKESFLAKNVRPVQLPSWARQPRRSLPSTLKLAMPESYRLENGLRLLVIENPSSDTVSVYGTVKNSPYLETPPGKEGVSEVLDELFSYGTGTLDRIAFQTALDDIAADESAGTGFHLRVLKQQFRRGVELLADNLLRPALPEAAFQVVRTETAGAVAGELQSPAWLTQHAIEEGLYPKGDAKLRHATPESVAALTLDDVRQYHRTVFRPDLTTIVVIGAVTPGEARQAMESYFGSWRASGPLPATDLPPVPPSRRVAVSVPDQSRSQDEVTLAETVALTRAHPDYYPLQVGLHVLSGGFYATRLYHELRERAGLVYAVEAFLQAGKTRSIFGVFYGCDPKNVLKARELVQRNLFRMQREPVSDAELRQAKTLLLRQILLARTSADDIAERLLALVQVGLPLDEPVRAARRYRDTSAAQVRKAFSRWIRAADFVHVTRGPAPP